MIINMNEVFRLSKKVVAFNFFNIETFSGILEAAEELKKPVIMAFGESYIKHTPLRVAASMALEYSRMFQIPFALHLDHSSNLEIIKEAIRGGFTSVMFDGSKLPLEENIKRTREVVEYARDFNVSVEGELGYLNKEDGSDEIALECTGVKDSAVFSEATRVDALAIAVGNAHGVYKKTPLIDIKRIREISAATGIPLVLHGSSGIPTEMLEECFNSGIRKINVNTEIALSASKGALDYIKTHGDASRFEQVLANSKVYIKNSAKGFLNF